jgi:Family of unknown function (DUF6644)
MTTAVHAIESSGLGRMMRESLWAYPIVETMHIVGLATVYGSVLVVDLRLLGLSRRVSVSSLSRLALPFTVGAFCLVLVTGLMMFTAHTEDFLGNRVFMLKMALIMAAGVNAALLHTGAMRAAGTWDIDVMPPSRVRVAAGASILLWTAVIACGRLLAYT